MMASKRAIRRRSCENKIRYDDVKSAEQVAKRLRRKNRTAHINFYKCGFCGGVHVGRMSKRQIQSKKDSMRRKML